MIADSLAELSGERLQRERWFSGNSSEMSSFVEEIEQLFTDCGLGDALEKGVTGYPKKVESLMSDLSDLVANVDGGRVPVEIIDGPKMIPVRAKSSTILRILES